MLISGNTVGSETKSEFQGGMQKIPKNNVRKNKMRLFFNVTDIRMYSSLWMKLSQELTLGVNKYPSDMTTAYKLLSKWRCNTGNKLARVRGGQNYGHTASTMLSTAFLHSKHVCTS